MEIQEIKQRLTLAQVLDHYGLKPDKNHRLNCPFHTDKTPSLQVYYKTQSCYCFSMNCPTNGKRLDVIDFVMHKEGCSKHQAIRQCETFITGGISQAVHLSRIAVLTQMFTYFCNAIHKSKPAQEYISVRSLDKEKLTQLGVPIGYNSGQFHHGTRKDQALIARCLKYGLLLDKGHTNNRTGEKAYSPFGKSCIVFPLRNPENQITGLYFRSTFNNHPSPGVPARHFYLKDRQGLYPKYPEKGTKKLILTESIIDAATLLQQSEITREYTVLALYGTNGFSVEHGAALGELKALAEVIFFFDGDAAGQKAVVQYGDMLFHLYPNVKFTNVAPPEGEDVNSLAQAHEHAIFQHLLQERKPIVFSNERVSKAHVAAQRKEAKAAEPSGRNAIPPPKLTIKSQSQHYQGQAGNYTVRGLQKRTLESMKVTLFIEHPQSKRKSRTKVDLYEDKQVEKVAREAAEKLVLRADLLILDIEYLTDLLDQQRELEAHHSKEGNSQSPRAKTEQLKPCIDFLKKPNVVGRFNELIGKAGVIGEANNRIFLFGIATSYKMPVTLHALIQGSSGSGKTHLLTAIARFIPAEDKKHFTRVTEGSLYNYGQYDLSNKLICLEDLDGMKEEAYLAFRELQSRGMISSSTSGKDEDGQIRAYEKVVYGPIASMSCTTKGEIYEDNMNRCFLIAVDESREQTERVIHYQNQRAAGGINEEEEQKVREFIKHCIRLLKPYQVINPYARHVQLPKEAHKIRRLNELYQSYVKQITLLNQYRRNRDQKGRLVAEKEDLQVAAEIMFDSILLKIDELDGSLRLFYERLKEYVTSKGAHYRNYSFGQREIRQALNVSKTQLHRYIHDLIELEYIRQTGGYANRGYQYTISYWDNVQALRAKVKRQLQGQLDQLEIPAGEPAVLQHPGTPEGTPGNQKKAV